MFTYLKTNRPAQFLVLGTSLMLLGFVLVGPSATLAKVLFYLAVIFLGYFATKEAIRASLTERSLNVDLLMILAALGAIIIGEEAEAVVLLFIFAAAEVLEHYVEGKSSSAITALLSQVPDQAHLIKADGQTVLVPSKDLQLGDLILVAKGSQFPIDGETLETTNVSEMALTGESLPVEKDTGQGVFAGTVNLGNAVRIRVTKTSEQTVFANIIRLVDQAQKRPSKIAQIIDTFESRYVLAVLLLVPLFILALMFGQGLSFSAAFYRGMVLLTVASPCALVASVTPATLSTISHAARLGVLVKGGRALENLGHMTQLFSDKTGTLTQGEFAVVAMVLPENYLSAVLTMEESSHHPIAQTIVNYLRNQGISSQATNPPIEEMAGKGMRMGNLLIGKPSLFADYADPQKYLLAGSSASTKVLIADGKQIVGYLALMDQLRPEAIEAVKAFQGEGIDVTMLTGDNSAVATKIASQAGIAHFKADCLPEDKFKILSQLPRQEIVGMIGDGINDAPALAGADIGIAMSSGSAVAMEAADIVMVQNNLLKLYQVFTISKRLKTIIWQNLIFSVAVILALIAFNILGMLDLTKGVIFHEGSTILVILNGLRLLILKENQHQTRRGGSLMGGKRLIN